MIYISNRSNDYLCKLMQGDSYKKIVFFDGVCGLCNSSVDWLLKHDKKNVLMYSPLQGDTFLKLNGKSVQEKLDSIVYFRDNKFYTESTAALLIAKDLGSIWSLAVVFFVIPSFIRNALYKYIARNRYKWFGKLDACRIPDKATRARFLD